MHGRKVNRWAIRAKGWLKVTGGDSSLLVARIILATQFRWSLSVKYRVSPFFYTRVLNSVLFLSIRFQKFSSVFVSTTAYHDIGIFEHISLYRAASNFFGKRTLEEIAGIKSNRNGIGQCQYVAVCESH